MRAVVTAGGTSEPVDDVRVITNLSTGRFGAAIANALAARGIQVTLLAGRALAGHPEWIDKAVHVVPFGSTSELDAALSSAIVHPPDLLFMAAAVSDYSPVRSQGKIRSDQDELVIRLHKNPKILGTLRARCGVGTFLVGFKLLSSVSPQELKQTAHALIKRDRLNLCVANDLAELGRDSHPLWLVTPEGGALRREGSKAEAAAAVVDFVIRRARVRWHRSVELSGDPLRDEAHASATELLQTVLSAGLLPGTDGNISLRAGEGLWTTPRQVDKSRLSGDDLVYATVDPAARQVSWQGEKKPSIDTAVHAALYRALPDLAAIVHFHDGLVLPDATTTFPYPCGTLEEAEEIIDSLAKAARAGRWRGGSFAVSLADHGSVLGITDPARLRAQWEQRSAGYRAHLEEIGAGQLPALYTPVFRGADIIGVSARFDIDEQAAWSTWLDPQARGSGSGDRVLEMLAQHERQVVVADRCEVLDFYAERGWRPVLRREGKVLLAAPTTRTDLIPAASVCLIDPVRRMVLIGERRTEPWFGYWAFPGGRIEPGESGIDAAVRELYEETGIRIEHPHPLREQTVIVGAERAFSVTNYLISIFSAPSPTPSDELDARWVSLDTVAQLRPMAAGTRKILRGLSES